MILLQILPCMWALRGKTARKSTWDQKRCCYGESKKHKAGAESSEDPGFLRHNFMKQARNTALIPLASQITLSLSLPAALPLHIFQTQRSVCPGACKWEENWDRTWATTVRPYAPSVRMPRYFYQKEIQKNAIRGIQTSHIYIIWALQAIMCHIFQVHSANHSLETHKPEQPESYHHPIVAIGARDHP